MDVVSRTDIYVLPGFDANEEFPRFALHLYRVDDIYAEFLVVRSNSEEHLRGSLEVYADDGVWVDDEWFAVGRAWLERVHD
mgnify:FL=1